ncbi:hypothetical protein BGZ51_002249 [Haplosporangium sp. Z 767]|nr:hypothetical protein BGZ51_002249 [Haplosporangium sp. Z 767]
MAPASIYLMVAIGMALQCVSAASPPNNNKVICTAPQCVQTAASILRDMNPQIDPCEDFNAYACGGFIEREEIPADQESIGYFHIIRDQNNRVIRSIVDQQGTDAALKNISDDHASARNRMKLNDLYESCMDEEQIASAGRQPVVDEVQRLLSLFPVPGSVLDISQDMSKVNPLVTLKVDGNEVVRSATLEVVDKVALSKALAYLNKLGLDSINSFEVSSDVKNPSRYLLELSEGGLGLPSKEYYLDEDIMAIYEKTIGVMFNLIMDGNKATTDLPAKWAEVAKDVVKFEKQLAVASTNKHDLKDSEKTYNPRSIDQVNAMTPSVDWLMVLKKTLPAGIKIPESIIVTSPAFQENIENLLQTTTPSTLQSYLAWTVIRQLAPNLDSHYRQHLRVLDAALSGVSADVVPDRWKHCVSVVNTRLGDMAGQPFIQDSFKGDSRTQVYDMIESLRSTFLESFPTLNWLDKSTAEGATRKMKAIVQLIGYSTESPNVGSSESLEEYYQGYTVDRNDYFGNQMRASAWETKKAFQKLETTVIKNKMHMTPQTVNAYYSPTENQIVFPAGILQPPFFHIENPEYVSFGGIGVVAGHEITHGFDNSGHTFDAEGRMLNWWSSETEKAFTNKARCFVEQYGNFTVKGADGKDYNVDGELTLGENIADNGGLKQSYRTWQARYNSDPSGQRAKNFKLPGLDELTPEQLFFISYARPWCRKQRPQSVIRQVRTDSHSPAKWRINGVVQNSVDFAKAFNCKAGAPMNPHNKCDLW